MAATEPGAWRVAVAAAHKDLWKRAFTEAPDVAGLLRHCEEGAAAAGRAPAADVGEACVWGMMFAALSAWAEAVNQPQARHGRVRERAQAVVTWLEEKAGAAPSATPVQDAPEGPHLAQVGTTLTACALEHIGDVDALAALITLMRDRRLALLSGRRFNAPGTLAPLLDRVHLRLGRHKREGTGPDTRKGAARGAATAKTTRGGGGGGGDESPAAGDDTTGRVKCSGCGGAYASRNALFRHLKADTGCAAQTPASAPPLASAPPPATKQVKVASAPSPSPSPSPDREGSSPAESAADDDAGAPTPTGTPQKKAPKTRSRREAAVLSEDAAMLWLGDIPFELATAKTVSDMLWNCKPRGIPQPYVKHVVRKGYRAGAGPPGGGDAAATSPAATTDAAPVEATTTTAASGRRPEPGAWLGYAFVVFRDAAEAAEAREALDGLAAHNGEWVIRVRESETSMVPGKRPAPFLKGEDPPLGTQLFPQSLSARERAEAVARHCAALSIEGPAAGESDAAAVAAVKDAYRMRPRSEIHVAGFPMPKSLADAALAELRRTRWPPVVQRSGMRTIQYLVLYHNKPNPGYEALAAMCGNVLAWADTDYPCSMIAVTKGFSGSPHIDHRDVRYQYAASFGEFTGGGGLCVESVGDPAKVYYVDTLNRMARVDGRSVHWVRGYEGERYSLIFFATNPSAALPLGEAFDDAWVPAGGFVEAGEGADVADDVES